MPNAIILSLSLSHCGWVQGQQWPFTASFVIVVAEWPYIGVSDPNFSHFIHFGMVTIGLCSMPRSHIRQYMKLIYYMDVSRRAQLCIVHSKHETHAAPMFTHTHKHAYNKHISTPAPQCIVFLRYCC